MNIQNQKKYHKNQIRIISLIDLCEEMMLREENFLNNTNITDFLNVCEQSRKNTMRFLKIKHYLLDRYERNQIN